MKKLVLYSFFFCLSFASAQTVDSLLKSYRSVSIQNKQKINLQANIETLKDVIVKRDGRNFYLKKGTYIKADSILIEVNNAKQIMAVKFIYELGDTPYIDEVPYFQKGIGSKGMEFKRTVKNKSISVTKWEDKKTILELTEVITDGKKQTYSVIFDKELYIKNYKSTVDLNKNDTSIELLKFLGSI